MLDPTELVTDWAQRQNDKRLEEDEGAEEYSVGDLHNMWLDELYEGLPHDRDARKQRYDEHIAAERAAGTFEANESERNTWFDEMLNESRDAQAGI